MLDFKFIPMSKSAKFGNNAFRICIFWNKFNSRFQGYMLIGNLGLNPYLLSCRTYSFVTNIIKGPFVDHIYRISGFIRLCLIFAMFAINYFA